MAKKVDMLKYLEDNGVSSIYYDDLKFGDLQKLYKNVKKIKEVYKKVLNWENIGTEINKILKKDINVDNLKSRLETRMEQFPDQYEVGSK